LERSGVEPLSISVVSGTRAGQDVFHVGGEGLLQLGQGRGFDLTELEGGREGGREG